MTGSGKEAEAGEREYRELRKQGKREKPTKAVLLENAMIYHRLVK